MIATAAAAICFILSAKNVDAISFKAYLIHIGSHIGCMCLTHLM